MDLLVDHTTNKASIDKHIIFMFAVLSCWVVVTHTLNGKDIDALLLGVLGIFIVQRTASKAIEVFTPK